MATKRKTGFDRYFERRMENPSFAKDYREARAMIDSVDSLIRAIEPVLVAAGLSKAELARRIGAKPESVRRLLTARDGNPTLSTILKVLGELDLHLEVAPNRPTRKSQHESGARA